MILSKPKNNKKKITLIALLVATLIAVGSSVYVYAFNGSILGWSNQSTQSKSDSSTNSAATEEQKATGDKTKEESLNQPATDTKNQDAQQPDSSPAQPTTPKTVDVTVTAAAQNGSTLQIRAFVGALNASGKCTLTLEQAGRPNVVKTAGIQTQASAAACDGFDIPVSELAPGTWKSTIAYTDGTSTGSTTHNVVIK